MLTWEDIEATEKFQALDDDRKRFVKMDWFEETIASSDKFKSLDPDKKAFVANELLKTKLPEQEEGQFQQWYSGIATQTGLDPNPDDPRHQYDYRGAFKAGATPQPDDQGQLHWPSQFKSPYHPNRFVDGQDTITGQPKKERGAFGELGAAVVSGGYQAAEGTARAARVIGYDTGDLIKKITKSGKEYEPSKEGALWEALTGGISSTVNSLLSGVPGAVSGSLGGVPGAALGFAMGAGVIFSLSEYDKFMEEAEKFGLKREDVQKQAIISAAAEGGFETISNLVGAKVFGLLKSPALKAGEKLGLKAAFKRFTKNLGIIAPVEVGTEMGTAATQAWERQEVGMPTETPWEAAKSVVPQTLVQVGLMGGAGQVASSLRNRAIAEQEDKSKKEQDTFKERFKGMAEEPTEAPVEPQAKKTAIEKVATPEKQVRELSENDILNLKDLGYSSEKIASMKPEDAIKKLENYEPAPLPVLERLEERLIGKPKRYVPGDAERSAQVFEEAARANQTPQAREELRRRMAEQEATSRETATRSGGELLESVEGVPQAEVKPSVPAKAYDLLKDRLRGKPDRMVQPTRSGGEVLESIPGTPQEGPQANVEVEGIPTPDMGPTDFERLRGRLYGKKGRAVEEPKADVKDKEPWEMTRSEFEQIVYDKESRGYKYDLEGNLTKKAKIEKIVSNWGKRKWEEAGKPSGQAGMDIIRLYDKYGLDGDRRAVIEQSIFEGKLVPPEVLADYPDLKPPAAPEATGKGESQLPPVKSGHIRFFHGGIPGEGRRWLSQSYKYAKGYADKTEGAVVQYVDIPENSPLLNKAFDDEGTSVKAPYVNFEAPDEIMAGAKEVPSAPEAVEGEKVAESVSETRRAALGKLEEIRRQKPSSEAKRFGKNGPTPEQKAAYDAEVKAWNKKYREAGKVFRAADEAEKGESGDIEDQGPKPPTLSDDIRQANSDKPSGPISEYEKQVADSPSNSITIDKPGKRLSLENALMAEISDPNGKFGGKVSQTGAGIIGEGIFQVDRPYGRIVYNEATGTLTAERTPMADALKSEQKNVKFGVDKTLLLQTISKDIVNNDLAGTIANETIQNALDSFSALQQDKKISVTIGTGYSDDGVVRETVITVEDNGSGMTSEDVEKHLLKLGAKGKAGTTTSGGYGLAKAAFLLTPRKSTVRTTKDGVTTILEGTREQFFGVKGAGSPTMEVMETPGDPNGTTFILRFFADDATAKDENAFGLDMYHAENAFSKYLREGLLTRGVTVSFTSGFMPSAVFETKPAHLLEQKYPSEKLSVLGNKIGIYFVPDSNPPWRYGDKYPFNIETFNKGLALFSIESGRYHAKNMIQKPDFKVIVQFEKTPDVRNRDYPFIRNRTELNEEVRKRITEVIDARTLKINESVFQTSKKDFVWMINNSPVVNGVKVLIPFTDTAEFTKAKNLVENNYELVSSLADIFKSFQGILNKIGGKQLELAMTVDPKVHGYRSNPAVTGHEIYAINPFAITHVLEMSKEFKEMVDAGYDPLDAMAANLTHTLVHEYTHNEAQDHNENFTLKLARNYTKMGHITLARLDAQGRRFYEQHQDNLRSLQNDFTGMGKGGSRFQKSSLAVHPARNITSGERDRSELQGSRQGRREVNLSLQDPTAESAVPRLALREDDESDDRIFLYHGTPKANLEAIRRQGLSSKLRQRNDYEEGDRTPEEQELIYFERNENENWGGKRAIQLRIDEDMLPRGVRIDEDELRPGEFYAWHKNNEYFEIPPEAIEYRDPKTGKWKSLVEPETKLALKQDPTAQYLWELAHEPETPAEVQRLIDVADTIRKTIESVVPQADLQKLTVKLVPRISLEGRNVAKSAKEYAEERYQRAIEDAFRKFLSKVMSHDDLKFIMKEHKGNEEKAVKQGVKFVTAEQDALASLMADKSISTRAKMIWVKARDVFDRSIIEKAKEYGKTADQIDPDNILGIYESSKDLIEIAHHPEAPLRQTRITAMEEALHRVLDTVMSPNDLEFILKEHKGNEENTVKQGVKFIIAEQDALASLMADKSISTRAKMIWKRVRDLFRKIQLALGANKTEADVWRKVMRKGYKVRETGKEGRIGLEVRGWHGSPHKFDKFSTDKIGTGEGAQSFGWGIYFTSEEDIARHYAETLSEPKWRTAQDFQINSQKIQEWLDGLKIFGDSKNEIRGIIEGTKEQFWDNPKEYWLERIDKKISGSKKNMALYEQRGTTEYVKKYIDGLMQGRKEIELSEISPPEKARNLYQVTLHKGKTPDQYTWLDWDKPVTQSQIDKIKSQLKKEDFGDVLSASGKTNAEDIVDVINEGLDNLQGIKGINNGAYLYKWLADNDALGSDREASLFLLRAGIDGIRYPAGSLSGKQSDAKNYVVFDENAVTIEERTAFSLKEGTPESMAEQHGVIYDGQMEMWKAGGVKEMQYQFTDPQTDGGTFSVKNLADLEAKIAEKRAEFGKGPDVKLSIMSDDEVKKATEAKAKEAHDWRRGDRRPFSFDPDERLKNFGQFTLKAGSNFHPQGMRDYEGKPSKYLTWTQWGNVPEETGVSYLVGKVMGKDAVHSIRFDKSLWSEKDATEWWREHHNSFTMGDELPNQVKEQALNAEKLETATPEQVIKQMGVGIGTIDKDKVPDQKVISRLIATPRHIGKKFEYTRKHVEVTSNKGEQRTANFLSAQGKRSLALGLQGKEYAEHRHLTHLMDGKNFSKDANLPSKWKTDPSDMNTPLEINLKYYEAMEKYLIDKGITPAVAKAFRQDRQVLDETFVVADNRYKEDNVDLEEWQEYRRTIGYINNYFPHQRTGNTVAYIIDPKKPGNALYSEQFNTVGRISLKGGSDAIKAELVAWAHKQGRTDITKEHVKIEKVKKSPLEEFFPVPEESMSQLLDAAINKVDEVAVRDAVRNILPKALADVFKARGWGRHMIQRKGTPGYETQDVKGVISNYLSGFYGLMSKMDAAKEHSKLLQEQKALKQPVNWAYNKQYVEDMMRNQTALDRAVDRFRAIMYLKYLGGVIKSGVVNASQNITGALPRLSVWTDPKTGKTSFVWTATNELGSAMLDMRRALVDFSGKGFEGEKAFKGLSENETDALKQGYLTGHLSAQYLRELTGSSGLASKTGRNVMHVMGLPMQLAEVFNRTSTFLAAYRIATKKGVHHGQAIQMAKDAVDDAHFVYGKENLPEPMRGSTLGRTILRPAYTFRTFTHQYAEFILDLARKGPPGVAAAMMSVGAMGALGGLIALPFYEEWRKLFDEDPATWVRKQIDSPWMRDFTTFGAFGLVGTDASGSLGMEVPKTLGELLGVPYAFVEDTMNMMTDIRLGDYYRAVADSPATPMLVRNLLNGIRLYDKGKMTRTGQPISMTPKAKEGDKITGVAAIGKALGFQPVDVSKGRIANRAVSEATQAKADRQGEFASREVRAKRDKDFKKVVEIRKEMAAYNKKAREDGRPQILMKDYEQAVKTRMTGRGVPKSAEQFQRKVQEAWK